MVKPIQNLENVKMDDDTQRIEKIEPIEIWIDLDDVDKLQAKWASCTVYPTKSFSMKRPMKCKLVFDEIDEIPE